jgi:type VI secretion system protein VasJ
MPHSAKIVTAAWVERIASPICEESPAGEDPRYLDNFLLVKEELEKLQGTDFANVTTLCRQLLCETSKDLRIAGYHILSTTYAEGLTGLLNALHAYYNLIDTFWNECFPQSETSRLAALSLLNNNRLCAFAEQHQQEMTAQLVKELVVQTDRINERLKEYQGEEVPRLTLLANWLEKQCKQFPDEPTPAEQDETLLVQTKTTSPPVSSSATRALNSEHDVTAAASQLHDHLSKNSDWLRALGISRAMRWGNLSVPPHDNGITRIPEPRSSGWTELEQSIQAAAPNDALLFSEKLFFEPGYHLFFDLQWQARNIAEKMGRSDIASFIENALRDLLERLPELLELSFANAQPFVGPECRQWIQQWAQPQPDAGSSSSADETEAALQDLVEEALPLARKKKLSQALGCLDRYPALTKKHALNKKLAEVQLCVAAGKNQMAHILLEDLEKQVLNDPLAEWEPHLAVDILRQRTTVMQTLLKTADKNHKQRLEEQIEALHDKACRLDLKAAASFI